ncbi:MAG: bile acid:sodium symporter family protein [Bacteroidales bacterium]|nr:bile acid:sodium symporter family protein [Bacteroidales bacterium]
MNGVFIVLPILTVLMFELGLNLKTDDFLIIFRRPKPVLAALAGQIVLLPLIAFCVAYVFKLPPLFFIGTVLIACCPGGSSSNVFSYLSKGDVALSVSLTALSSVITLFTVPLIMNFTVNLVAADAMQQVHLPVGNLLIQNLLLMFLPIVLGMLLKRYKPSLAAKTDKILSKCAFALLMFLAGLFFVQNFETIKSNFITLGTCITLLILLAAGVAYALSLICALNRKQQRTVVIEVGMQNAAQAIAVACSPFIFNNSVIAVPAIIYALMMNVILLAYVGVIRYARKEDKI